MKYTPLTAKQINNIIITGRRRSEHYNKKLSVLEQLLPYKNARNIFISFTNLNKIGINPKSKFNTPLGIYAYPLCPTIWKLMENNDIPFGSERPYIQVIKATKKVTTLSQKNFSKDKIVFDWLQKMTFMLVNQFDLFNDDEELAYDTLLDTYLFYARSSDKKRNPPQWNNVHFQRLLHTSPQVKTNPGVFWYITHIFAQILAVDQRRKASVIWNSLWRLMNCNALVDYGQGIIHSNEPYQAVFFSKDSFKHINTIYNQLSFTNDPDLRPHIHDVGTNLVEGNLFLEELNIAIIKPSPLTVTGDVKLGFNPLKALPSKFKVYGSLYIKDTNIRFLPKNLYIGEDLISIDCRSLKKIEEGVEIGRDLFISNSNLAKIHSGLKIGRNLSIDTSPIKEFPSDVQVGNNISIKNCDLNKIPDNLTVFGTLDLRRNLIKNLPANLVVHADLHISSTAITSLPEDLKVGRYIYISPKQLTKIPKHLEIQVKNDFIF